jgi:hypothetical protein
VCRVILALCLSSPAASSLAQSSVPAEPAEPAGTEPTGTEPTGTEPGSRPAVKDASAPATPADLGRPCDKDFFNPCPVDLVCVDLRCVPKTSTRAASLDEVGTEPKAVPAESVRPFRLGVQNSFFFGFAGAIQNPQPAYTLTADFGFPTGRRARWHVELGYMDLNGYSGFRINPFVLGYTIPLMKKPVQLEVEVIAAILQSEILFNDGFAIALSSGLRAQLVLVYGIGFVAFAPIGFEIRYAYGLQDIGVDTGVGANWPLQLTIGVEL